MPVECLTKAKDASFADISRHLSERGAKPIEEFRLGAGNFLLYGIILHFIERVPLETEFGEPHEFVNGFARYRRNDGREDVYIRYLREPF